ncbi:glycosyltransferase [Candidatus Bathyarchaeota archaeon]|nr:glycosyltransferase [Candidatus Bathyarchaeota archaeon]
MKRIPLSGWNIGFQRWLWVFLSIVYAGTRVRKVLPNLFNQYMKKKGNHKKGFCIVAVDVGIPGFRGASIHVSALSKVLIENGHEVHVVCRRTVSIPAYEFLDGVHIHRIYRGILAPVPFSSYTYKKPFPRKHSWLGGILRSAVKLCYRLYLRSLYTIYAGVYGALLVRRCRLDVILERETSFGAGALASILSGKPLILQTNAPVCAGLSLWRASKVLAYPMVRQELSERGVPEDRLVEFFPTVNTDIFKPDPKLRCLVRDRFGLEDVQVVGYVGIFAAWHGIPELLEAARLILKQIPTVKFLLVGPYHDYWSRQVQDIADSFIFVGPVPHETVPGYINASDVMVAPFNPAESDLTKNREFPFIPFKLVEYLACGKPAVSTSVGWIPKMVNGISGVLVGPGDPEALAKAVVEMLNSHMRIDDDVRRSLLDKYSMKNCYDTLMGVCGR